MNMKSYNPVEIKTAFDQLFNNLTEKEKVESEAKLIMFRFLSLIEDKSKSLGLSRKQLAEKIGTSPSFITQLFRGDKLVNLLTLAKFQNVLDLKFDITDKKSYEEKVKDYLPLTDGMGFWVYHKFITPDYESGLLLPDIGKIHKNEVA